MLELIGKKIGMTHMFRDNGELVPLTMVQLYDNCVLDHKINEGKDFDNLSIAFDKVEKSKKLSKSVAGIFNKKSVPTFRIIHNSRVKKGAEVKVGEAFSIANILNEGDKVSVQGVTIGKGFAGVMKRWNFRGLEATHGVSVSHRSHGSTGQRQDPGKVFKGKKMAGHLGVENVTIKNLEVAVFDKEKSIVGLKGAIPGSANKDVVIKIAKGF